MIGNSPAILHAKTQLPIGLEQKHSLPQEAANDSENLIKDLSLAELEPKAETNSISDKFLPAITYSNAALNIVSILASAFSLKTGLGKEKAQSMEKFGLLATKAQAIAAGIGFMEKAFKTKYRTISYFTCPSI